MVKRLGRRKRLAERIRFGGYRRSINRHRLSLRSTRLDLRVGKLLYETAIPLKERLQFRFDLSFRKDDMIVRRIACGRIILL